MSTKMSNMTEKFTVCFTFSFEYFFLFFDTLSFRREHSLSSHTHTHTHNPHHTKTQLQDMEVKQSDEMMTVQLDIEEGDERRAQAEWLWRRTRTVRSVPHQAPRYLGHVQEG